ncbi:tripartite tricarboxylate transporter TctB family protein [Agrobacterium tumefaciens]|uniref:tripartite tricarboxylate transporter TctB family protein n=1 Tax=Agrobacterium tumefaciens TaxID=358 RepID=UPI001573C3DB|nr:tripartite tricarboxylate transporter TctB family protein [Agrobacterium tumefaciens]
MGVFYLILGAGALAFGSRYTFGSAANMGPGYLPYIVSILMTVLGCFLIFRSFRHDDEPLDPVALKPILLVLAGILLFALLIQTAGFLFSGVLLVILSALASHKFKIQPIAILGAVVLITSAAIVFILGLGLAMPIFGFGF